MNTKRNVHQWIPALILSSAFTLLWGTARNGGEQGVLAWLLLRGGLPYVGGIFLLGVVGVGIWKRQFNKAMGATLLGAFLTIWPAFWGLWPLALKFPVTIEQMAPAAEVRLPADAPLKVAWWFQRKRVIIKTASNNLNFGHFSDFMLQEDVFSPFTPVILRF